MRDESFVPANLLDELTEISKMYTTRGHIANTCTDAVYEIKRLRRLVAELSAQQSKDE